MRQLDRTQLRRPPRPGKARSVSATSSQPRVDPRDTTGRESISDDRLLALAAARSPGVEALLYRRLSPVVNRLVWRLLGPDSEFQDTTHDVFIRIFRGILRLRDPASLEEWAARVTVNTVKNVFRRRTIRKFIGWDPKSETDHPFHAPDFEHRELVARTYRILDRLPAEERIALTFDLFEPLSIEQIAARVGVSIRTVKRRLKAARSRFERAASRDPVLAPWLRERTRTGEP